MRMNVSCPICYKMDIRSMHVYMRMNVSCPICYKMDIDHAHVLFATKWTFTAQHYCYKPASACFFAYKNTHVLFYHKFYVFLKHTLQQVI